MKFRFICEKQKKQKKVGISVKVTLYLCEQKGSLSGVTKI